MKHKSHDLLFKAFSMLDISLLQKAVKEGEELNTVYSDEDYDPFWLNDAFSRFLLKPEDWRLSEVEETWNKGKKAQSLSAGSCESRNECKSHI